MAGFTGFPPESAAFLSGIGANNEKAWFEANRGLYEAGYVAPATAFVSALGPRLGTVSPEVHYEPRINGSVMRINRDVRFSKDKRPYKSHLDMMFWHGDKRGFDQPGFWFRFTPESVYCGVGMHRFDREALARFRESVVHPRSGRALVETVARVRAAGPYEIGERTRSQPPRGFATEPDRADYLLFEGLTASIELPPGAAATADLVDLAFTHYKAMWPVGEWLMAEVAG